MALDLSNKEAIIANYDPQSDEFKEIAVRSDDFKFMYGTNFLIFERTTGRFLEFFCGTKSTRPIASDIAVFLPLTQADIDFKKYIGFDVSNMEPHESQPCTLKVHIAKHKRGHSWYVPDPQPCSIPFTNLPSIGIIMDEINFWRP